MAVITQFVVVRDGVEKMTFASKKEADAYDRMLDVADNLIPFLQQSELELEDSTVEKLAFYLASHKDTLSNLLKGGAPVKAPAKRSKKSESETQQ
ncbi:hypothetical protein HR45_04045 [Shewanella mangrovi]|uniref:Damage-inducible protein YebG n=1 Tax=Shewanella mangrovi TaxID=1515746 RepID=A0A094LTS2_9GAMM|nr:YebG family protein [Shewanella mangrovi]KFZ38603.1 hypothetical protein HR45_04045 [Shewanella mangrovi]